MRTREPEFSMKKKCLRGLYDVFFLVFALGYLPLFFLKGKHRQGAWSRFGVVPHELSETLAGREVYWIHAVSVGEMVQAVRFLKVLKERFRDARFVLTATTSAGYEAACRLKDEGDRVLYFPVDFRWAVRAFVERIRPRAVMIMETEIWPNLFYELSEKNIPVFIMNGRISDKALRRYRSVRFFLGPLLNQTLRAIAVQDSQMHARFLSLGVDESRLRVTGNMKFDWTPERSEYENVEKISGALKGPRDFLWIAGSTHEGEEEAVLEVAAAVRKEEAHVKLLIAPRHLERIPSIEKQAAKKGWSFTRISGFFEGGSRAAQASSAYLLDRMGALANLYRLADAVFIGGSLVPVGGHNLVEPAYFGKPVLFGPWMNNFREMVQVFKEAGAGVEVSNAQGLRNELLKLIRDPERRNRMGAAARNLVAFHQGATLKNRDWVVSVLTGE